MLRVYVYAHTLLHHYYAVHIRLRVEKSAFMQTVYFQNDIIIGLDNFPKSKWGCAKGLLVSSFVVAGDVDVLGDEGGV